MTEILDLICYKDGQYIKVKDASPTILDFGFIHSDATYDVIKLVNGKLFLFEDHYQRFSNSTSFFGLENRSADEILKAVEYLADVNQITTGFVWLISWRGIPASGSPRDINGCPNHFVIYVKPYYDFNQNNTSTVVLYKNHYRVPDTSFGQQYKNFSWIELTLAQRYAISRSADTALLTNSEDKITEGPGFGVGFVFDNSVVVPKHDVLHSITIKEIERICREKGIDFQYDDIDASKSLECDEMFLASTSGGIIPVSSYEGRKINNDNIVKVLQNEFRLRQDS